MHHRIRNRFSGSGRSLITCDSKLHDDSPEESWSCPASPGIRFDIISISIMRKNFTTNPWGLIHIVVYKRKNFTANPWGLILFSISLKTLQQIPVVLFCFLKKKTSQQFSGALFIMFSRRVKTLQKIPGVLFCFLY